VCVCVCVGVFMFVRVCACVTCVCVLPCVITWEQELDRLVLDFPRQLAQHTEVQDFGHQHLRPGDHPTRLQDVQAVCSNVCVCVCVCE
jgi:hypothetical protein